MRRPRRVVGYVEVEGPQARLFRVVMEKTPVDQMVGDARNPPVLARRGPNGEYRRTYWCAADKPEPPDGSLMDDLRVKPVYNNTELDPPDARCEECSIPIRDLQATVNETLEGIWPSGR